MYCFYAENKKSKIKLLFENDQFSVDIHLFGLVCVRQNNNNEQKIKKKKLYFKEIRAAAYGKLTREFGRSKVKVKGDYGFTSTTTQ